MKQIPLKWYMDSPNLQGWTNILCVLGKDPRKRGYNIKFWSVEVFNLKNWLAGHILMLKIDMEVIF